MNKPTGDSKIFKYRVYTLDVWGHGNDHEDWGCDGECEGYTVNDRCQVGTVTVEAPGTVYNLGTSFEFTHYSAPNDKIVQSLKDQGYLKNQVTEKDIEIEGESDSTLYVDDSEDGCPLFQLEFDAND